ncbi:hypothetical protein K432DRAFT_394631 [Lepidopterella palustris CBS 459.81]|uniref:Uncharacterized protein n=1 Tax=Lepidopterella palustris CBS 459.81 TaxID=1314670 RepID=A0A8E2JDI7_9PEZI|nr:hypothetical protein K432DRAFT_394631 [Lepidopterella palustris CBS 459.81]
MEFAFSTFGSPRVLVDLVFRRMLVHGQPRGRMLEVISPTVSNDMLPPWRKGRPEVRLGSFENWFHTSVHPPLYNFYVYLMAKRGSSGIRPGIPLSSLFNGFPRTPVYANIRSSLEAADIRPGLAAMNSRGLRRYQLSVMNRRRSLPHHRSCDSGSNRRKLCSNRTIAAREQSLGVISLQLEATSIAIANILPLLANRTSSKFMRAAQEDENALDLNGHKTDIAYEVGSGSSVEYSEICRLSPDGRVSRRHSSSGLFCSDSGNSIRISEGTVSSVLEAAGDPLNDPRPSNDSL